MVLIERQPPTMLSEKLCEFEIHPLGPASIFWTLASLAWAAMAAAQSDPVKPAEGAFKIESNLRAGVAKIDITPPAETKVVGHVRETHGARDPIRAAVLLLDDGRTKAALVTFDLLAPWDELVAEVRSAVSRVDRHSPGEHPGRLLP